MLHCPEDKTMDRLDNNAPSSTLLQPTPKAVAILHAFCERIGINQMVDFELPEILQSSFNSMELIYFERDSRLDSIIHNEYWDKLLFLQVMGSQMNVWSSSSSPEHIKNLGECFSEKNTNPQNGNQNGIPNIINPSLALTNEDEFFQYLRKRELELLEREKNSSAPKVNSNVETNSTKKELTKKNNKQILQHEVSPFYHKFFTNPDSDCHIQYYTSKNGLRFFKAKTYTDDDNKIQTCYRCFSGKALVQYLMDCTDLMYLGEAIKVSKCFLKYQLIEPLNSQSVDFKNTKESLYVVSDKGLGLLKWKYAKTAETSNVTINNKFSSSVDKGLFRNGKGSASSGTGTGVESLISTITRSTIESYSDDGINGESDEVDSDLDVSGDNPLAFPKPIDFSKKALSSSSTLSNLSLIQVLHDPGLKYLLRQFLIANVCVENLNAYDDIVEFQRRIKVLKKLLSLKDKAKRKYIRRKEVQELISHDDCPKDNSKKVLITFRAAIKRLSESSLIKVYNIYAMFLSENAPNELNIDSKLRKDVQKLITNESTIRLIQSSTTLLFEDSPFKPKQQYSSPSYESSGRWSAINKNKKPILREVPDPSVSESPSNRPSTPPTLKLNLKIPTMKIINTPSPTDVVLGPTLNFLDEVNFCFDQIKDKTFKMMETDSLGKFLSSKAFKDLIPEV